MRVAPAGTQRPFVGDVGRHLEQIGLGVFDQLGPVITQQPQEHLLGDVADVGCRDDALFHQEPAQGGTPLAEPQRQTPCGLVSAHEVRLNTGMKNLLSHKTGLGHRLAPAPRRRRFQALLSVRAV